MNIKNVIRIASITFEESYRKKFLYILFFLVALVIIASYMFQPFELKPQLPVVIDISLTALNAFALILTFALFLSAVPIEIEKKTIYPLISKPITRSEYLWGKLLGNMFMILINLLVLGIVIMLLIFRISGRINLLILNSVILTFVECGILGALIILFSPWMSYPVNLVLTLLLYISGNVSQAYIEFLATDTSFKYSAMLALALKYFLPNFEFLHIKNSLVHSYIVDPNYIAGAAVYGVLYILIVMVIADLAFRRKDL